MFNSVIHDVRIWLFLKAPIQQYSLIQLVLAQLWGILDSKWICFRDKNQSSPVLNHGRGIIMIGD